MPTLDERRIISRTVMSAAVLRGSSSVTLSSPTWMEAGTL